MMRVALRGSEEVDIPKNSGRALSPHKNPITLPSSKWEGDSSQQKIVTIGVGGNATSPNLSQIRQRWILDSHQ